MQGLSGAQFWYENNFLLCEASVDLEITRCKISSQYGPEIIRFAYCFHSLHPEHSYTHTSDGCATQQRQKIIKQITKMCKASRNNINSPP